MKLRSKLFIGLTIAGTLSSFVGCHSNTSSPASANSAQAGTAPQTNAAVTKKCDAQRMDLRKTAMQFLGIDALQIASDKLMKELTPQDLKKLVSDGIDYRAADTSQANRDNDLADMTDIMVQAAGLANVDTSSPILIDGTTPVRELDMGYPYFVDPSGDFTLGQAVLQKMDAIQVNDIMGVMLGIGLDKDPTKSFQSYTIGLQQVTDASNGNYSIIPLSKYIEAQLPTYCQGITGLDPVAQFNLDKIPVGASN